MKTITVDFSSQNPKLPDEKIIGCEGIHNSVKLVAILPERMICEQIKTYTMMFCNGEGEVLYSDELLLDGNEVSCVLWQQLFCGNELSVQIQGMGFEGGEITVVDKTGIAEFQIARSIDGQMVQSDFEANGISAQLALIREKIALIEILGSINGVALSKTEINSRGELLLTYSNGKTYNVGTVKGDKGENGLDGKDGENGKNGKDGKDGENGIPTTHSWNGSVLTVTSASGTSSADLKGEKGDKGEKGEKGDNGEKGVDGYTPVKGIDYWSSADKKEMNADNIGFISAELAKRMQLKPEFANSIEECTDTNSLYVLPDGYIYAYMTATVYPEIVIEEKSGGFWQTDSNNNIIWASSNSYCAKCTNLIPVTSGDKLEYTGMAIWAAISVAWFDSAGNVISTEQHNKNESSHTTVIVTAPENAAGVRFYSFRASSNVDNVILEAKWISCASATSTKWTNTGICFVALEQKTTAKSPLAGKKIVYDGDSICAGVYGGGGYAKLISDLTESTYVNHAVGGGRLVTSGSRPDSFHSIVDNLINLPKDGDLYCFEGGINDWWSYGVLGSYDTENFTGELDTSTVCGALETIFRFALGNPVLDSKPICFVITHKIQRTAYVKNANGDTFKDYHDAMVGICNKYSIPYYDAFLESGLNGWNDYQNNTFLTGNADGTPDGCHPNEKSYKRHYVPQLISLFEKIIPRGDVR